MNTSRVMIPALLAAALIGGTMTSDAFAGPHHRGQGNGYGPCYGYGDGGCWEGGWGHHGHARGWGYRAMSDAQRAKFDKIMEEFAPRMEQLRDSIYVKRQELRALENATNPDVKAVREAATEMARLRNEMADLHDACLLYTSGARHGPGTGHRPQDRGGARRRSLCAIPSGHGGHARPDHFFHTPAAGRQGSGPSGGRPGQAGGGACRQAEGGGLGEYQHSRG